MNLKLEKEQYKKWGWNLVVFSAPALCAFFYALSKGVALKEAWPVALVVFWGILADYFKKLK